MKIENKLREIFENKGIFIPTYAQNEPLFLDSLQFVSLLVEVEEQFNIEIDDSYYIQEKLSSFADFVEIIKKLL